MAWSEVSYAGDGKTDVFNITFPYMKKEDIYVFIDNDLDLSFTWVSDTQIKTSSIPTSEQTVTIQRNTEKKRQVDFQNGALVNEAIMDKDSNQIIYLVQEAYDRVLKSLNLTFTNFWDALGKRIRNVGIPKEDTDATTKVYVDTGDKANNMYTDEQIQHLLDDIWGSNFVVNITWGPDVEGELG